MKKNLFLMVAVLFSTAPIYAQETVTDEYVQRTIGKGRQYIVVILKEGKNLGLDEAAQAKEQEAHLKYLFTLKEQGKLPIFGPFFNSGELSGLCVFNSDNMEEVKSLIEGDPHIKSGHLIYEIHQWFSIPGSALP
jgi:uncharacterized protein YciI